MRAESGAEPIWVAREETEVDKRFIYVLESFDSPKYKELVGKCRFVQMHIDLPIMYYCILVCYGCGHGSVGMSDSVDFNFLSNICSSVDMITFVTGYPVC